MKRILTVLLFAACTAALSQAPGAPPLSEVDTGGGEAVYSNCVQCHQASGAGRAYAYPPLAGGHAAALATAEGGRAYLVNVLLHGVQGEIVVDEVPYNGVMPGWSALSDEEIAGVLNYTVTAWENREGLPDDFAAFTADEVAAARGVELSTAQVYELRQALELGAGE